MFRGVEKPPKGFSVFGAIGPKSSGLQDEVVSSPPRSGILRDSIPLQVQSQCRVPSELGFTGFPDNHQAAQLPKQSKDRGTDERRCTRCTFSRPKTSRIAESSPHVPQALTSSLLNLFAREASRGSTMSRPLTQTLTQSEAGYKFGAVVACK